MKTLCIEWQRLLDEDQQTCPRCGATEQEVGKALRELGRILAAAGIAVSLVKKVVAPEDFRKDPLQSNRVLIAGKALEQWLGATTGASRCCDACGDAECRTVELEGNTHEAVPAELIVRAGLAAAAQVFGVAAPRSDLRMPASGKNRKSSTREGG